MAGVEEKIIETGGAHNRRAVGRHRAQAAPKSGLCGVAAVGIQIVEHQFERFPPLRIQLDLIARQFGHAAHADAFIKAGDGHFIGFIDNGRHRCGCIVDHRHRERIAFHGIHRQIQPQSGQRRPAEAAQGAHKSIGLKALAAGMHGADFAAGLLEPLDVVVKLKHHAFFGTQCRQAGGEKMAVAGAVVGQIKRAGQLVRHRRERGLIFGAFIGTQAAVRHAVGFEHRHIFG